MRASDAVPVDEMMLQRGPRVHDHQHDEGGHEREVDDAQHARERAVLGHEVGQRDEAKVDHLNAGRRAVDPSGDRHQHQERVQGGVHGARGGLLPGRHRHRRRRRMSPSPRQAQPGQQEHGDADPLVPQVPLQLARRQRERDHRQAEQQVGHDEERRQPVQRDGDSAVALGSGGKGTHACAAANGRWRHVIPPGARFTVRAARRTSRTPFSSISTASAVSTSPIRRSNALIARSPSSACRRPRRGQHDRRHAPSPASARAPTSTGARDRATPSASPSRAPRARRSTAPRAARGTARRRAPRRRCLPCCGNTMRRAIRNRMMPPAIDSDTSDSCSHCMNVRPPAMNASRITNAKTHSRSTTRRVTRRRHAGERRHHERQVAERIEHEQQQDRRGEEVVVHRQRISAREQVRTRAGTGTRRRAPCSANASPANAPASALTWNARAVPMPCAASPSAKPRARQSRTRHASSTYLPSAAPRMPVVTANTAASAGRPPSFSRDAHRDRRRHRFRRERQQRHGRRAQELRRATARCTSATTEPTTSAPAIGTASRRTLRPFARQRHREPDHRRPEQEVHELRAVEVGLVRRCASPRARRRSAPPR